MELFNMQKINKFSFWLIFFTLPTLFLSSMNASITADQITLAWDSNTEPDLEGYIVQ